MRSIKKTLAPALRAFAEAWPEPEFVQHAVGQIPWGHNLVLLTKVKGREVLLCKSKNKIAAEYALRTSTNPIGVAEFQLIESLPKDLEANLPSIEQIERELGERGE